MQLKITKSDNNTGLGVFGLAFLIMFTLKLLGVVDISWFWVFSPFWIIPMILIFVASVLGLIWLGCTTFEHYKLKNQYKRRK